MTRAVDLLALQLEDLALDTDSIVAGSPRAGVATVLEFGETEIGVWELTEGTVTDTEVDEVFVVVAGSGSVTFADGERLDLAPGVLVQLHQGEQTTWTITSPLRKVWITH